MKKIVRKTEVPNMDTKNKLYIAGGLVLLVYAVLLFALFNANSEADALAADNLALNSDIEALEADVEGLGDQVEAATAGLNAAQKELETNKEELSAKDSQLAEALVKLEEASLALEEAAEKEEAEVETLLNGDLQDNLFLGDSVDFVLDDGDLPQLFDGEIEFDDDDYDVHEEFAAIGGKVFVAYSAVDDEELADKPALGLFDTGALEYRFVFDDPIELAAISDDEPLDIVFLGQEFSIVEASAGEISLRSGEEFYLREGDSVEFEGHNVILELVGENGRASVCVDDECDVVDEFDTETINGVDVRVEDILVNNRQASATLVIGSDTIVDQKDGDEFLDNDDSPFEFRIETSGGNLDALIVSYDEKREDVDDEFPPLFEGDSLAFPYDFITVTVHDVLEDDYVQFDFEFDGFNEELEDETDIDNDECMRVSTNDEDIEVGDEDVDQVWICSNGLAYYEDTNGEWYEADVTDVNLVNDDAEYSLAIGGAGRVRIESADDVLVRLDADWAEERLGAEEDDAEADDILFGTTGVGNQEYDILTPYGAVLVAPESGADRDEFSFLVPTGRVELEVLVA